MSKPNEEWYDIAPKPQKLIRVMPKKEENVWLVAQLKGVYKTSHYGESDYPTSLADVRFFNMESKMMLHENNGVVIPLELIDKINWKIGDELYADIFDEDLKQIVIGKKLSGDDAIKGLDKITAILE